MNILFITLLKIETLKTRGIYHDLMREFSAHNHNLYIISPTERREKKPSSYTAENNVHFLIVKTLNVQKTNLIEKGIATLTIEKLFLRGVKKNFSNVKFDLVIYSTPPITFTKVVSYIKDRDGAKSYLLLKDIFPQNAVDMKLMSKDGFIHRFFRKKEKELYEISDAIGCMSLANKKYLIAHNPQIDQDKVEVNSNCIEPIPYNPLTNSRMEIIKMKYGLPLQKMIFVYGGNLGIPQGVDFLIETIVNSKDDSRLYFLIVGSGTEFNRVQNWFRDNNPANAKIISGLPTDEYHDLLKACDVGMIFLSKDFTIPNFPSRLLSYLEYKLPILVAADPYTDIGEEVKNHKCGVSVLAGNMGQMNDALDYFCDIDHENFQVLRENCRKYLEENFLVSQSYEKIIKKLYPSQ